MLNGIGGSTVEEAKERLTEEEFLAWASFRKQFGSLNIGWRLEWEGAKLRSLIWNYARDGKKYPEGKTPDEFMEHWPEEEKPLEEVLEDSTLAIVAMMKAQKSKG